jgi:vacuolar-type H+-ATPase subunit I/STV1
MHIGDDLVAERNFEVVKDPRLENVTQDDFVAQFELVKTIKAKLDTTHKTINRIREVRKEINEMMAEAKDNKELQEKAKTMLEAMSEVENELMQTKAEATQDVLNFEIKLNNKLAALASTVATGYGRPTKQQYAVYEELAGKVDVQFKRLQAVWDGEYENIIQEFESKGGKIQN